MRCSLRSLSTLSYITPPDHRLPRPAPRPNAPPSRSILPEPPCPSAPSPSLAMSLTLTSSTATSPIPSQARSASSPAQSAYPSRSSLSSALPSPRCCERVRRALRCTAGRVLCTQPWRVRPADFGNELRLPSVWNALCRQATSVSLERETVIAAGAHVAFYRDNIFVGRFSSGRCSCSSPPPCCAARAAPPAPPPRA